ncbi:uncharacterized protein KY384_004037 [Bacidia gigantensis]|uniref:uncharacterized protein n=1 Tax=Bacidia gigantensis TaxID=2732470 RepID=UPI001D051BFA|nr:uncharacterized protein KY384_004037 [Bacidia gigantensis]KAG8530682.1 hypothetical protein KY384_004037 [Bacidia gigantensis]
MSRGPAIQGSTSATWAIAVICVALRFIARRASKAGVWYDDWMVIPGLKIVLGCIFGLGSLVIMVSGVRLHHLILYADAKDGSITKNLTTVVILTSVEVNTSIICACLPCLRPIGSFVLDKIDAFRKRTRLARQGNELLNDMLPRRKQNKEQSSTSHTDAHPDGLAEMNGSAQDLTLQEAEATGRAMPEMAGVGIGPLEMGTADVAASELRGHKDRRSPAELEAAEPGRR